MILTFGFLSLIVLLFSCHAIVFPHLILTDLYLLRPLHLSQYNYYSCLIFPREIDKLSHIVKNKLMRKTVHV